MKLDQAVKAALKLDDSVETFVSSHGGSGFSSTYKITTKTGDGEKMLFMKTGQGKDSEVMFEGEHTSLNAIHDAVPNLCPKSYVYGALQGTDSAGYFLVTDFLDLSGRRARGGNAQTESLAKKLGKLHSTPTPEEHEEKFGFPVPTCCGNTIQDNTWESTWPEFFGKRRLMAILKESERNNGADKE